MATYKLAAASGFGSASSPQGAEASLIVGTLGLPQRSYTAEEYGAMLALIHFRQFSPADRARIARGFASRWQGPRTSSGLSQGQALMRQLGQLRMMAYGAGTDDYAVTHNPAIVMFPWALTDKEFSRAYMYVRTGQFPSAAEFGDLDLLSGTMGKVATSFGKLADKKIAALVEAWLVAEGGRVAGAFFKVTKFGPVALTIDIAKQVAEAKLSEAQIQAAKVRYEWERVRRGVAYV